MAGKINVPVAVAIQGLAKTRSQLGQLGKGLGAVGKSAGLAAIGFGAFVAGVKGSDFAVRAIAGARDLERNMAGLKTVFEETTPQMEAFSKKAVNLGLSLNEASKSSTFIGSVLKQSGFDIQQTADLTENLVGLATDLSITYGYDVQEALLGMTALFRGEYDPIEKFGVAMKQSEINAELAARGMGKLEGAQRRFAEQQIRVELLFQRSSDAVGALERQTGTLAVEQLRLQASFANVKDTVATSLLPVITAMVMQLQDVMTVIGPELRQTFEQLAPVLADASQVLIPALVDGFLFFMDIITELIDLAGDMFDPFTAVGESIAALGIQIGSLFETITGNQLTVTAVFDIITEAIRFVADAVHDVIYIVENAVIIFRILAEAATLLFTGDWNKLAETDWRGQINAQIELKDGINATKLEMVKLYEAARASQRALGDQTEIWDIKPKVQEPEIVTASGAETTKGAGGSAKNYVKDFFNGLQEEIAKQSARMKLERLGASEGLIGDILGTQGWQTVYNNVIKDGKKGIKDLQNQFAKTASGIEELAKARQAASEAAQKAAEAAQEELDKLQESYQDVLAVIEDIKASLLEVSTIEILPTIEKEIGAFENSIISSFDRIRSDLESGFIDGALLQEDFNAITAWASAEGAALQAIAKNRDDLANRYSLSESLIAEYRSALTSALNLSSLLGDIKDKTTDIMTSKVTSGTTSIGNSLKDLKFTLTTSYTETITEVVNKTEDLVNNFKSVAEKARTFAQNLRALKQLGLDPQLFNQLVQAGVEAGGETAQALIDGGSTTVNEINSIFKEIDAIGAELGEEVATTLYGSGIDLMDGLLAGIRSKQGEMESLAQELADAFKKTFDGAVGTATGKAAATAQLPLLNTNLESAQANVDRINGRILEQVAILTGGTAGPGSRAAAQKKLDSYTEQIVTASEALTNAASAIANANSAIGLAVDLPSSTSATFATQSAGVVNNNYNVTVTADSRLSGSKAGEAIVQTLKTYQTANGPISTVLTV